MKIFKYFIIFMLTFLCGGAWGQIKNPILPGFHPDPSICRVGNDYYLVNSSFVWFPGLPIYHSKDLAHWELIGHAVNRAGLFDFHGADDDYGIWAPTIRHHNKVFYIVAKAYKSGGTFYVTASNPAGPWSDPVFLPKALGIDPDLFFDDDGRSYLVTNGPGERQWRSQTSIWMQEIDLEEGKLLDNPKRLTFGFASNAAFAESPHLYKRNGKYILMHAEGGTGYEHAVVVHQADSLWGPYTPDYVNPILTHRHLGRNYPINAIGHADLVETQHGEWFMVMLGKRSKAGKTPLGRETFLAKVDWEGNTP